MTHPGLAYLESLRGKKGYLAPSEIDPRFTLALYVNARARGRNAQRMWVLQRDALGGPWRLALWDKRWWKSAKRRSRYKWTAGDAPPFSWLVSTGRKYRGDKRSGPTPLGVFALDERRYRSHRGYHAPGMVHVMYIDYHYRSGRRSGVAFHGTTPRQYRKLGRIDSHGCIRMHQRNALALLSRLKGWDKQVAKALRWGEVPRFWKRQRYANRYGYTRDGRLHAAPAPVPTSTPASTEGPPARPAKPATAAEPARAQGGTQAKPVVAVGRPGDATGSPRSPKAPAVQAQGRTDAGEGDAGVRDDRDDADAPMVLPRVLTKTGYRALTVIFQD
ncbi:MAG: L,D-transpeptidase family protein [Pseudomonadota bacterium]